jgi:ring-1,2-phenylacetyl-CoA epoxidase subunit PaaE
MADFIQNLMLRTRKNIFFFAGGSGITPIFSIINSILLFQPESKIILFYGNLDETSIIFKQAISDIQERFLSRFSTYTIVEKQSVNEKYLSGRLTKELVKELLDKFHIKSDDDEYFICGPSQMMKNVEEALEELAVSPKNVHLEYFSAEKPDHKVVDVHEEASASSLQKIKLIIGGVETDFSYEPKKKAILDEALDRGIDVPYSCKEAICCSCRGKVLEGKVKMKENYSLLDEEVAEGYVLTCQSIPLTPYVVISYDA